jgi:hypothetical protein
MKNCTYVKGVLVMTTPILTHNQLLTLIQAAIRQYESDAKVAPLNGNVEHYIATIPMISAAPDMYDAGYELLKVMEAEELINHPKLAKAVDAMCFALRKAVGKRKSTPFGG